MTQSIYNPGMLAIFGEVGFIYLIKTWFRIPSPGVSQVQAASNPTISQSLMSTWHVFRSKKGLDFHN